MYIVVELYNIFIKEKPETNEKPASPFANFKIDAGVLGKADESCEDDSCGCNEPKIEDKRHRLVRAADYAFIELLQDISGRSP